MGRRLCTPCAGRVWTTPVSSTAQSCASPVQGLVSAPPAQLPRHRENRRPHRRRGDDASRARSLPWTVAAHHGAPPQEPLARLQEEITVSPHPPDTAPAPPPRTVLDVGRRPVEVVPGRWDPRAEHVFSRGQCLALAVAVARSTGRPVAAHTMRDRGREVLRHCYAQLDGSTVLDASGAHDLRAVRTVAGRRHGERVRTMSARAAWAEFRGGLVPQDVALARSFVPGLLGRARGTGRGAHAVRRD